MTEQTADLKVYEKIISDPRWPQLKDAFQGWVATAIAEINQLDSRQLAERSREIDSYEFPFTLHAQYGSKVRDGLLAQMRGGDSAAETYLRASLAQVEVRLMHQEESHFPSYDHVVEDAETNPDLPLAMALIHDAYAGELVTA